MLFHAAKVIVDSAHLFDPIARLHRFMQIFLQTIDDLMNGIIAQKKNYDHKFSTHTKSNIQKTDRSSTEKIYKKLDIRNIRSARATCSSRNRLYANETENHVWMRLI